MPKLSWKVYRENFNAHTIEEYDIFQYSLSGKSALAETAKELKRQFPNRFSWEEAFRLKLQYYFWSKSEHEIVLTSWPPYIEVEEIDNLQKEVKEHEEKWGYKQYRVIPNLVTAEKVDIYSQIMLNRKVFFDYVWGNI